MDIQINLFRCDMHTTGELVAEHVRVPSGRAVPAFVFELRLALGDAQARALFNAR